MKNIFWLLHCLKYNRLTIPKSIYQRYEAVLAWDVYDPNTEIEEIANIMDIPVSIAIAVREKYGYLTAMFTNKKIKSVSL
jgi:hypothetical protein